jgi:hypothetical protein
MCSHTLHTLLPLPTPTQVAGRTNDSAGDGTTTASVLAREMIHFGLMAVTSGANPIAVKKGIDKTQEYLVGKLKENAKPVQGRNDIRVSGGKGGGVYLSVTGLHNHVAPAYVATVAMWPLWPCVRRMLEIGISGTANSTMKHSIRVSKQAWCQHVLCCPELALFVCRSSCDICVLNASS